MTSSNSQSTSIPDISIVIVNHNTRELLHDCLRSIEMDGGQITLQVIAVDNGSRDGSAEMVMQQFPWVTLIRNNSNEGFAKPNNQGLQRATGRYCLLLNSDTIVKPHSLKTLIAFMDAHPEVGACGPRLVNPDGTLQRSCRNFPSLWRHFCDMSGLENLFPGSIFGNFENRFGHDRDAEVDQPMGAALLVRSEVIQQIGYLDERFKIYYNEVDWCRRIIEAGWKIYFVRDAEIIHYGGKTTAITNSSLEQFDEMSRNTLTYFEKHFGSLGLTTYRVLLVLGFSIRVALWRIVSILRPSPSVHSRLMFARKFLSIGLHGQGAAHE
jgi:hypothetical protein